MNGRIKLQVLVFAVLGSVSLVRFVEGEDDVKEEEAIKAGDIALIDVARVFKDHIGFRGEMERMKDEITKFEEEIRERQGEIKQQAADATLGGTEDRAAVEAETIKAMSDLKLKMELKRKELMKREARLFAATYQQVAAEVRLYSRKRGIRLVLKFDSKPIDPEDRKGVLQGVNNNIVFQDGLDITDIIVERLNGKTAAVAK